MVNVIITIAVVALCLVAFILLAYALALWDKFFMLPMEGTHNPIMRGRSVSRVFLAHRGYFLNVPWRRFGPTKYDPELPKWSRREGEEGKFYSSYSWLFPHLKLLERLGIYWYGWWPIFRRYKSVFDWVEVKTSDETKKPEPWHRSEKTNFAYSAMFTYWLRVEDAVTKDNIPLVEDYWLSVEVVNAYQALFGVTDWLTRLTADANQVAKIWSAGSTYEELEREAAATSPTSGGTHSLFAQIILALNDDLVADEESEDPVGAPIALGVKLVGASLQRVRSTEERFTNALAAKAVAEREAQAAVATAKGDAKSTVIRAKADKKAINLKYTEINEHENGVAIRGLEAMEKSGENGNTVVWANNPLGNIASTLGRGSS